MLADARGHDGVVGGGVAERLQHELRLEGAGAGLLVVDQGEAPLPLAQLGAPRDEPSAWMGVGHRSGDGRGARHGVARGPTCSPRVASE